MLGAIVGDLAAWTYENDKERFYSSLTSKDALLSPFGKIAYETAIWNLDREEGERITLSPDVHWGPLTHAENLIRCATLAWTSDMPFNLFDSSHGPFYDDKEGWYAGNIIVELIDSLHHGKTKKEVLMTPSYWCNAFQELKSYWKWQIVEPEQGLLIYLMRAWNCFEKAWDFTSAIHNAARWQKVDRHLLCSITGALAESMYGCEFNFLKKKYGDSCEIAYPEVMAKDARRIHSSVIGSSFQKTVLARTWRNSLGPYSRTGLKGRCSRQREPKKFSGLSTQDGMIDMDSILMTDGSTFIEVMYSLQDSISSRRATHIPSPTFREAKRNLNVQNLLLRKPYVLPPI